MNYNDLLEQINTFKKHNNSKSRGVLQYNELDIYIQNVLNENIVLISPNNKFTEKLDMDELEKYNFKIGLQLQSKAIVIKDHKYMNMVSLSIDEGDDLDVPNTSDYLISLLSMFPNLVQFSIEPFTNIKLSDELIYAISEMYSLKSLQMHADDFYRMQKKKYERFCLLELTLFDFSDKDYSYKINLLRHKELQKLKISFVSIVRFEEILNLQALTELSIKFTNDIPVEIFELTNLEDLSISAPNAESLPIQITNLSKLKRLSLSYLKIANLPNSIDNLKSLEYLYLRDCHITKLPDSLCTLQKLHSINLFELPVKSLPSEFGSLANLTSIYIRGCDLTSLPDSFGNLQSLQHLYIYDTNISCLPIGLYKLTNLRSLILNRSAIDKIDEGIGCLENLEILDIGNNRISFLPISMSSITKLKSLNIGNTKITAIPDCIEKMKSLELLDLSNLNLDYLPSYLIELNLPFFFTRMHEAFGIRLENVTLKQMPISLFEQDTALIREYYYEDRIMINDAKCVFLGDGGAGKTYIIDRMINKGMRLSLNHNTDTTPGIAIKTMSIETEKSMVNVQVWDFGGQEIMHSMHRCFLTSRTLYVIVLSAREDTQNERAYYWLNNVQSFAKDCPVIAVINKIDENPNASLNETELKRKFPCLTNIIKLSATYASDALFLNLMDVIRDEITKLDSYCLSFPRTWAILKQQLQTMDKYYLTNAEYSLMCDKAGITNKEIQIWLLDWFNDLGVSFSYHKDRNRAILLNYMVLNPRWLTNAIYIIIFCGQKFSRRGMMEQGDIVSLLQNPPKSVENSIRYDIIHIPYILEVMRKFEISYQLDSGHEFIPALCDRNESIKAPSGEKNRIRYFIKYQYLPNNVIHKLMIKLHDDIIFDEIWLTGARFENKVTGCWAVIKASENILEIEVNSTKEAYEPWTYLTLIRSRLLEINGQLNLNTIDYITYVLNGKSDDLLYDDIIQLINDGRKTHYSIKLKCEISVFDIIKSVEGISSAKMMQENVEKGREINKSMNITNNFYGCDTVHVNSTENGTINESAALSEIMKFMESYGSINKQQISSILELVNQQGDQFAELSATLTKNRNNPTKFKRSFFDWLSIGANTAQIASFAVQLYQIIAMVK